MTDTTVTEEMIEAGTQAYRRAYDAGLLRDGIIFSSTERDALKAAYFAMDRIRREQEEKE